MSSRRTIMVVAAVVLAVLAGGFTTVFLGSVKKEAYKNAKLVTVFRASGNIDRKTSATEEMIDTYVKESESPQEFLPSNAITNKADLKAIIGKVALHDIAANEILTEGDFVPASVAAETRADLLGDEELTAVTVSVDQVKGVGGNLAPGDFVNIVAFQTIDDGDDPLEESDKSTRVLYQKVKILFIGQNAAPSPTDPATPEGEEATSSEGSGLITFAVLPEAANRIIHAVNSDGGIWLTLVSNNYDPTNIPDISDSSMFKARNRTAGK